MPENVAGTAVRPPSLSCPTLAGDGPLRPGSDRGRQRDHIDRVRAGADPPCGFPGTPTSARSPSFPLGEPEVNRDGRDRIAASVAVRRDADRGPGPLDTSP